MDDCTAVLKDLLAPAPTSTPRQLQHEPEHCAWRSPPEASARARTIRKLDTKFASAPMIRPSTDKSRWTDHRSTKSTCDCRRHISSLRSCLLRRRCFSAHSRSLRSLQVDRYHCY